MLQQSLFFDFSIFDQFGYQNINLKIDDFIQQISMKNRSIDKYRYPQGYFFNFLDFTTRTQITHVHIL